MHSRPRPRTLTVEAFARAGGDFDAGRRLPLQFAASLRPRLLPLVSEVELGRLLDPATAELAAPERWGTTFTLIQARGARALTPGTPAARRGSLLASGALHHPRRVSITGSPPASPWITASLRPHALRAD